MSIEVPQMKRLEFKLPEPGNGTLKTTAKSEWAYQIGRFLDAINPAREAAGFEPYSASRMAGYVRLLGATDAAGAARLYGKFSDAAVFGKAFEWKKRQALEAKNRAI